MRQRGCLQLLLVWAILHIQVMTLLPDLGTDLACHVTSHASPPHQIHGRHFTAHALPPMTI